MAPSMWRMKSIIFEYLFKSKLSYLEYGNDLQIKKYIREAGFESDFLTDDKKEIFLKMALLR